MSSSLSGDLQKTSSPSSLNLSGLDLDKITDIPENSDKIKSANLDGNRFEMLPLELYPLSLELISIRDNGLNDLSLQLNAFSHLIDNLKTLILANNKFTKVPHEFGELRLLEDLDMSENQLVDLDGIEDIANLRKLNVSHNQIQSIPKQIEQLHFLEELDVSDNQLSKLPQSLADVPKLEKVYLSGNKLTKIADLSSSKSLHLLDIRRNPLIKSLPKNLDKSKQITVFGRPGKKSRGPSVLKKMLVMLTHREAASASQSTAEARGGSASHTLQEIKEKPDPAVERASTELSAAELQEEADTEEVHPTDLGSNFWSEIPDNDVLSSFSTKLNASFATVEDDATSTFDSRRGSAGAQSTGAQTEFSYHSQDDYSAVEASAKMKAMAIQRLRAADNPNIDDFIKKVNNAKNREEVWGIIKLNDAFIVGRALAQKTDFKLPATFADSRENIELWFGGFKKVYGDDCLSLNIVAKPLEFLPEALGQFNNLEGITIQHTNVKKLPGSIGSLGKLKYLTCSNNYLKALPKEIGDLSSLVEIDVRDNMLQELPEELSKLPKLKKLDIRGNPIEEIPNWLREMGIEILSDLDPPSGQPRQDRKGKGAIDEGGSGSSAPSKSIEGVNSASQSTSPAKRYAIEDEFTEEMLREFVYATIRANPAFVNYPNRDAFVEKAQKAKGEEFGEILKLKDASLIYLCFANSHNLKLLAGDVESVDALENTKERVLSELPFAIDFCDTTFQFIPESIGQFSTLSSIKITDGKISELPASIVELPNLKTLNLSHNRLEKLPEDMGRLQGLTELDLSHNKLVNLPKSISEIKGLQKLDIRGNPLEEIPVEIFQMHTEILYDDPYKARVEAIRKPLVKEAFYLWNMVRVKRLVYREVRLQAKADIDPPELERTPGQPEYENENQSLDSWFKKHKGKIQECDWVGYTEQTNTSLLRWFEEHKEELGQNDSLKSSDLIAGLMQLLPDNVGSRVKMLLETPASQ